MKEKIERLIELQKIETETSRIRLLLNGFPAKMDTLDSELKAFEQTIADESSRVGELKKEYRGYESDALMNRSMIQKSQEKLGVVKTNKEYQSFLKEIEELEVRNSRIEDDMLECLERIDQAENSIATINNEYLLASDRISREKEIARQEMEQEEKRLDQLNSERDKITNMVDPDLLERYRTVKKYHADGRAIVPAKNSVCLGCNVNIPPQEYNELQRCDSLKFCPNCQRIIYWEKS